ncbi:type III pantothenate kinase [Methylotenera sp.]|uniref:type III pantothenate kinase n=1 Tax=Methylotenera sp. TaxID=2051956 RepID=UPI00248A1A44|nr:type III pantothenate kinase [Methylotenera sp.]MDI1298034.1 type III pantothenate kinase [Methylotenera sp.]
MDYLLAIDAGNTRVKWGLFDANGTLLNNGACLNTEIARAVLPNSSRIIVSNVAGEYIRKQLENILPTDIPTLWITAKASERHVNNHYDQPEKLGTDRWAALVAAWHIKHASCVVVNAGTAVTIDALTSSHEQGEFIGGMILPGIDLMQQSLGLATAQLPNIQTELSKTDAANQYQDIFAKNTADAMRTGAINAACGAIKQMHSALAALTAEDKQAPYIFISGGNAQLIKDNLLSDVTNLALIVDNLVLRGLHLIDNFAPENFTKSEKQ